MKPGLIRRKDVLLTQQNIIFCDNFNKKHYQYFLDRIIIKKPMPSLIRIQDKIVNLFFF